MMTVKELSKIEFDRQNKNYISCFDKSDFHELNRDKVQNIHYLLFSDKKAVLALVLGQKDNVLLAPFSSPFSAFSSIKTQPKISDYVDALEALEVWAKSKGIQKIEITLPPQFYHSDQISKATNALFFKRFDVSRVDLNFNIRLSMVDETYLEKIDIKARQKLRQSLGFGLAFSKADEDAQKRKVYEVIETNRREKGYPLWMTYDGFRRVEGVLPVDYFIVEDEGGAPVASAICYRVTAWAAQVIYWGHLEISDHLRPMNFLSFKVFEYYKNQKFEIVDTGPSTANSVPNFGLSEFKQSIGCVASTKLSFGKVLG